MVVWNSHVHYLMYILSYMLVSSPIPEFKIVPYPAKIMFYKKGKNASSICSS